MRTARSIALLGALVAPSAWGTEQVNLAPGFAASAEDAMSWYSRGYLVTPAADVDLEGLSVLVSMPPSTTAQVRIYDESGDLRVSGASVSGAGVMAWTYLPVSTRLDEGEEYTVAFEVGDELR